MRGLFIKKRHKIVYWHGYCKIINMNENSIMSAYIKDMSRFPLLNRNEEQDLAVRAKAGDKAARAQLINSNLRFVVKVAKQYQGMGLDLMDLISEGNIGLIMAADRFDVAQGNRFISYAVWWIKAMIRKALTDKASAIRLPAGHDRDDIEVLSLDAPCAQSDDNGSLLDTVLPTSEKEIADVVADAIDDSVTQAVNRELLSLPAKEAHVLRLRYGLCGQWLSLKEVGDKMHLTKEGVRQIEKRAFARLRQQSGLEAYVA